MQPKISVIVPVYNTEKYLRRCIDSIVNQTYTNLEIILIDDGSTDGSGKIVDEYAKKDSRIIVVHQQNKGESAARNRGLDCATGDYIAFVDCDDWLELDMYRQMLKCFEKYSVDLVAVPYYEEYDNYTKLLGNKEKIEEEIFDRKKLFEYVYIRDKYRAFTSFLWCKLFKRELFENAEEIIRFDENIRFGADLIVFIKYASRVKKAIYINKSLYHYYQRKTSTSHSQNLNLRYELVEVYIKIIGFCEKNDVEIKIIPWLERFTVYHATLIAEIAIEQKDVYMLKKCQNIMKKYENSYVKTNQEYEDRLERYYNLKDICIVI